MIILHGLTAKAANESSPSTAPVSPLQCDAMAGRLTDAAKEAQRERREDAKFGFRRMPRRAPEPRSLPPSSWPWLEAELRRWVEPGFTLRLSLLHFQCARNRHLPLK